MQFNRRVFKAEVKTKEKDLSRVYLQREHEQERMRKLNNQQSVVFKRFLSEWNVNNLNSRRCERFLSAEND